MKLHQAKRSQARIRIALQGPSGSGKTYSSLLLAYGLTGDWSKIAVIDTENQSADLYAHLGTYQVLSLTPPYTPERYMEAIRVCEKADMEAIILDSLSHEWDGEGGILNEHAKMQGNSFTNWGKLTPRHNQLIQSILNCRAHIIATIRTKQEHVLMNKDGKNVSEKVGLKSVQRDGLDYDFTILFEIDIHHHSICTKDRTQLFMGTSASILDYSVGVKIKEWCESGEPISADFVLCRLKGCSDIKSLLNIFYEYPQYQTTLLEDFELQKQIIIQRADSNRKLERFINNGTLKTGNYAE